MAKELACSARWCMAFVLLPTAGMLHCMIINTHLITALFRSQHGRRDEESVGARRRRLGART